jgi:hypothetical protein
LTSEESPSSDDHLIDGMSIILSWKSIFILHIHCFHSWQLSNMMLNLPCI